MFLRITLPLLLFGALITAPSFLLAGQDLLPRESEIWLRRSLEIIEQLKSGSESSENATPEFIRQAEEVAKQTRQKILSEQDTDRVETRQEGRQQQKFILFFTLGDPPDPGRVRHLLQALEGEKNIVLVLRGLPVGVRRIDQVVKLLSTADDGLQEPPSVLLDPESFQKYRVTQVPTVVVEENGLEVLRVAGVTDPQWIKRRIEKGQRGDLGLFGEVEPVAERNLMDEIRDRLSAIDWRKEKEQSLRKYWDKHHWVDLPRAKKNREFRYTPEFAVTADVAAPNGQLIARKGDRVRPLEHIPGTFFLVIFDASDSNQVQMAKSLGRQIDDAQKRVKYLSTRIDPGEDGWKEKLRLEQELGGLLYFIDMHQARMLRLENIPATVEIEGGQVVVREYHTTGE